jgi:WD40 repeat protein
MACLVLRPHTKRINFICANPVKDEFVTVSNDKTWKLWRLFVNEKQETSVMCVHSQKFKGLQPKCCCLSSDGSVLIVMYEGGVMTLWDPVSGDLLKSLASPSAMTAVSIAAVSNSSLVVGLVSGECVWVYDLISCSTKYRLKVDAGDLAVHSRLPYFSFITYSGKCIFMSAHSPAPIWCETVYSGLRVQFVDTSDYETKVAVLTKTGNIQLMEAKEISRSHLEQNLKQSFDQGLAGSGRSRFDGILGTAVPSSASASQNIGRNNVSFPASFLPNTASHVLPSSNIMLTSLMTELLRINVKKDAEDVMLDASQLLRHSLNGGDDEDDLEARAMEIDEAEDIKHPKLPHHFSSETREELAGFFKKTK